MSLKNARVLVIGGTSGIGLGVASAAAERGAIPIVVSRQQSSVDHRVASAMWPIPHERICIAWSRSSAPASC
jgi:NAD(P)-dependent dehydrogenase (short-subunit alcohol dehydrogenase family)